MFKIICQNCGEECEIEGYISTGGQGASLIRIDVDLEAEDDEVTGKIEINCENCGNNVYLRI